MKYEYKLGDIFRVPFAEQDGHGYCVPIRWDERDKIGSRLLYVAGFSIDSFQRSAPDGSALTIRDAQHFLLCYDRALYTGRWPRVGRVSKFDSKEWPLAPCVKGERMNVTTDEATLDSINISSIEYIAPSERAHFSASCGIGDSSFLEASLPMAIAGDPRHMVSVTDDALALWLRVQRALVADGVIKRAFLHPQ